MSQGLDVEAVLLAVVAALIFAVANNLQRGAASVVPLEAGGRSGWCCTCFRPRGGCSARCWPSARSGCTRSRWAAAG